MILYRMMSTSEFRRLIRGEILKNNTDQSKKYFSSAQGFCFNDESMIPNERKPFHSLMHLKRVLPPIGVWVKLDIPANRVEYTVGEYRSFFGSIEYGEHSTTEYGIPLETNLIGYRFCYYEFRNLDMDPEVARYEEEAVSLKSLQGTKNLIAARKALKNFLRNPETYVEKYYYGTGDND